MIVEAQVTINGSKVAIWAAITKIENASETSSGIKNIEILEKPANGLVGLKWRETRMLFGEPATAEKWITDAAENELYKTKAEDGGFGSRKTGGSLNGTASVCDRRGFLRGLVALGMASPLVASCAITRRASPVRRIGFISGALQPLNAAFEDELRRLGYAQGENIVVEMRVLSDPDELQRTAEELARSDLELIVAGALPFALAVREANPAMPMVIATCPGMISNGFAQTLERPGGIVTGMDELPPGVTARRLNLLKTAAPRVSRVALLSTTPGKGGHETQLADAEQAADALDITVKPYRAASVAELEAAFASIAKDGCDGLLSFQGGLSLAKRQSIVDFAAVHRVPGVYQATLFAEAGGLMSWAPDLPEQFREAARYVDKILKGESPGELPIQHPPKYFLTVNAIAARKIDLVLPPTILAHADRVLD